MTQQEKCSNTPNLYSTGISFLIKFFKVFFAFKFSMLDKKAVLTREKIKTTCLTKELSLIVIKITFFYNLLWYPRANLSYPLFFIYFIIKSSQINLLDFLSSYFMIFTLNLIHQMSQTFLIHLYSL